MTRCPGLASVSVMSKWSFRTRTIRQPSCNHERNCREKCLMNGAAEKTRTSTGFTPQRPQRCASTNSATAALLPPIDVGGALVFIKIGIENQDRPGVTRNRAGSAVMHDTPEKRRDFLTRALTRLRREEPVILHHLPSLSDYERTLAAMRKTVAAIRAGEAPEQVWFLEHPPLYTAGTSARKEDLLDPGRFPVYRTGRGGQYTYHGPGQRVAYVMLDLNRRGRDVRLFIAGLEQWIIDTLAHLGVHGERREDRVGVWVRREAGDDACEEKIAAIGVRVSHWVSWHGVALNVAPDLSHFKGIVPCGIRDHGVTSLKALGLDVSMAAVDAALIQAFSALFGPLVSGAGALPDVRVDGV